jgi:hypothetical protein
MMKIFVILSLIGLFAPTFKTFAQDPSRPQLEGLKQTGKLFTVTLTPQDKVVRIDLAGTPAAKFDFKNKQIEVLLIEGASSRRIRVSKRQDGYFITEPLSKQQNMELEVKASHKNDSETFRFKIP